MKVFWLCFSIAIQISSSYFGRIFAYSSLQTSGNVIFFVELKRENIF